MSKQPWDLRDTDKRESNTKPTFIIFCEDEVCEPIYFKYFETSAIKVNPIKNQKSGVDNVFNAINYCEGNELMERRGGLLQFKDNKGANVWCVFDRDKSESSYDDNRFDESIETAERKGINVAWSNDAFELWILLHFEDVDPDLPENKLRKTYYDRLTDIFKNLPKKNEDLVKALSHTSFGYKKDLKRETNIRQIVRPELIPNTHLALQHAKTLEAFHATPNKPNHEKAPCTTVHHLVEELLKFGGKEIV